MQQTKYHQLYWEDIQEGATVPDVVLPMTFKRVIHASFACWDFFPGHHDPDYAKSQGQKTIYVNTIFFQGFVDRIVTEWAGPMTFISRRKINMKASLYAGDTAYGRGTVTRVYTDDVGQNKVDLEITISNDTYECCSAEVTIILPVR